MRRPFGATHGVFAAEVWALLLDESEDDALSLGAAETERGRGGPDQDGLAADDAEAAGHDRLRPPEVDAPQAGLARGLDEDRFHAVLAVHEAGASDAAAAAGEGRSVAVD